MKKIYSFMAVGILTMAAHGNALAAHEHTAGTPAHSQMRVYECPMDKYTIAADCPMCGMKMQEKHMDAAEAKAAIAKSAKIDTGTKAVVSHIKRQEE